MHVQAPAVELLSHLLHRALVATDRGESRSLSDRVRATRRVALQATRRSDHVRRADIVIAAAGRPNTVTADMVKEGAAVIDVGVNRVEDATKKRGYRLVGDVDFEAIKEKASFITPVPGGVGPMTVTMLLMNTVEAAEATA